MKHPRAMGAALIVVATATIATGCGSGDAADPPGRSRTIQVSMTDNEFTPDRIEVEPGQEITFEFRNDGKVDHEAILGTEAEQADHEAEMAGRSHPMEGMDHGDGSSEAITVAPGRSASLHRTFDRAGTLVLGCHEPGHYEAGMQATITIG